MKEIRVDSRQLSYTLNDNLTHFTTYNIELYVCRELLQNENQDPNVAVNDCSVQKAMTSAKTKKKGEVNFFSYLLSGFLHKIVP